MRININLSEELIKQIDVRSKSLFISRSAYIATALSQKMQSDKMLEDMPNLMQTILEATKAAEKVKGDNDV